MFTCVEIGPVISMKPTSIIKRSTNPTDGLIKIRASNTRKLATVSIVAEAMMRMYMFLNTKMDTTPKIKKNHATPKIIIVTIFIFPDRHS